MVLVFDLDDTLYNEITFVLSGYRAVSDWLHLAYQIERESLYNDMRNRLITNGRNKVFDDVLSSYGIYSDKLVRKCLSIYRLHKPSIELNRDAITCLERFKNFPKYIVTDGNRIVQAAKVQALGLEGNQIKKAFITYRYGLKRSKPSPYCFLKICTLENVSPEKVIYIGDNPNKDFVGIKPLGFKTIRILQGMFKDIHMSKSYEADLEINSLNELTVDLLREEFKFQI
jgi:putative hydrolase of the HAD superfamily